MLNWLLATALALQANALPPPPAVEPPPPSPPEQVLAVPEELRAMLQRQVVEPSGNSRKRRLDLLLDFMFDANGLGMQYQYDATHTVAESFRARKANCLAFTLLTVALAREAGLLAYGQEIDRVMSWQLTGDLVTQSTHVNAGVMINGERFVADVASDELLAITPPRRIDDRRLLALFYNNHAMQMLVDGHPQQARTWLDAALRQGADPMLLNNSGVLSLRSGDPLGAEQSFLRALQQNPRHSASLFNLVAYYQRSGDSVQTARWQKHAARVLRRDPMQQFTWGLQSEQAGDYAGAARHFRQAIALDRDERLFHFGLARAYLGMGQLRLADNELVRAHHLSSGDEQARYQAKLDALRRMQQR